VVPFMMPCTLSIRFAFNPSRSDRRIGMPPPTLASNATSTPRFAAAPKISLPYSESSALFAVTTCLPASIDSRISLRANSYPPTSSTTMSTESSAISAAESSSKRTSETSTPRSLVVSRSAIRTRRSGKPSRCSMTSALRSSTFTTPVPMVPKPTSPTPTKSLSATTAPTCVQTDVSRRNRRIPRTACLIRCLFSTNAKRT